MGPLMVKSYSAQNQKFTAAASIILNAMGSFGGKRNSLHRFINPKLLNNLHPVIKDYIKEEFTFDDLDKIKKLNKNSDHIDYSPENIENYGKKYLISNHLSNYKHYKGKIKLPLPRFVINYLDKFNPFILPEIINKLQEEQDNEIKDEIKERKYGIKVIREELPKYRRQYYKLRRIAKRKWLVYR